MCTVLCLVHTCVTSLYALKLTGTKVKLTRSWLDCSDTIKRSPFCLISSDLKNQASPVRSNLHYFQIVEDVRSLFVHVSFLSLHSAPYKVPPFFHSFTSPCSPLLHFSVFYSSLLSTSLLSSQLLCSNTLPSLSSLLLSLLLSIYPARQTADPTPKWNAELIAFHLPFIPFLFLSFPPQIGPSERRFKKKKRA